VGTLKLVILGVDSTHTEAFCETIANTPALADRAKVIGLWGESNVQAEQKAKACGISQVFETAEQAIAASDGVLVLGRFPESHFSPALKALQARRPTFVDKPFVLDAKEAQALLHASKATHTPLISCSAYRFADSVLALGRSEVFKSYRNLCLSGPRDCLDLGDDPRFKDISFYGIHLIEIMLSLLGHDIIDFKVTRSVHSVVGNAVFSDGRQCSLQLLGGISAEGYHVLGFDGQKWNDHSIEYAPTLYGNLLREILNHFNSSNVTWPIQSNEVATRIISCLKGEDWNA
jgi:hypothetical protein